MMTVNAPQDPTVVNTDPIHDKYVIQFAPELTDFIRIGEKTRTYRFGNKYEYLKVGDEVELREYGTSKLISKAEITDKTRTFFRNISLDLGWHVYDSKDHQRKVLSSYYKYIGREIEDDDPLLIISFELV